jgi:hypothetical protein
MIMILGKRREGIGLWAAEALKSFRPSPTDNAPQIIIWKAIEIYLFRYNRDI